jgi:tetratricopeptide (TPR) repeat protein
MSLLLDALKKAELAKQIAKAESPAARQGEPDAASGEPSPRVITREKLPDITQPLEILTDDLPSSEEEVKEAPKERPELSLQEPQAFAPAPPPPAPLAGEPEHSGGRAQAEQFFQVKEMEYNPRRPFYLTLSALGVVAAAYGGYVWWQMQPKYSFSPAAIQAAPAAPKAPIATAALGAQPPQPAAAITPPQASPPAATSPVAGVQVIPPIQPARPRSRPRLSAETPPSGPAPAPPAAAVQNPEPGSSTPIAINAPILSVDPLVEQGYQAFQKGDLAAARDSYQRALARTPSSRDALLGLAAIEVRNGQLESAEARYLKLLEMDPRDGQAVAGLVALRGRLDPVASESRLKTLLASQPDVAQLHFSLGNQYAHQSRWAEAQAAYFRAFSLDPENADYAFNLAVSLDQLRQKKTALDYYQRALALAEKRAPTFDLGQARQRVQELSK